MKKKVIKRNIKPWETNQIPSLSSSSSSSTPTHSLEPSFNEMKMEIDEPEQNMKQSNTAFNSISSHQMNKKSNLKKRSKKLLKQKIKEKSVSFQEKLETKLMKAEKHRRKKKKAKQVWE